MPLSSQTNSNGIGTPWYAVCNAALMAPTAVEWFADASPETAHRQGIGGPRAGHPQLARAGDRECHPQRPWQMGGDRRGLRNDVEIVAAEHLVPATGDRFLGGGHQAEQHVTQRVAALHLAGTRQEETTRPVVQQCRVGGRSAAATAALLSWPADPMV